MSAPAYLHRLDVVALHDVNLEGYGRHLASPFPRSLYTKKNTAPSGDNLALSTRTNILLSVTLQIAVLSLQEEGMQS